MAVTLNASSTAGFVTTADTSTILQLQTNGTTAVTVDASQAVTIQGLTVGRGAGAVATNTAVGASALQASNSGTGVNTAVGYSALYSNTTGYYNTAIGAKHPANYFSALENNTTGNSNIAFGTGALGTNTTGSSNTAIGFAALPLSTTASNNTAVGFTAGYSTTGGSNTFVGHEAGYSVTSGTKNTIIGRYPGNQGGLDIRTASNNIVISDGDGNPSLYSSDVTNGAWRINSVSGSAYSGFLVFQTAGSIGSQLYHVNSTDRLIVENGSAGVYLASGGTSWTSNSDERKKDIIEPITNAANKVSTLRTVIGKYKTDQEGTRRSFLIAQDVLAVFPEAVDASQEDDLGVQYQDVIPLLVAAIKELKTQNDSLTQRITALEGQ